MKKIVFSMLCAAAVLIVLPGCDTPPADSDSGSPATIGRPGNVAKPKIALVMKSLANEFFQTMEAGAKQHQQESNAYELLSNGIKDEKDVTRQIDLVEQMASQGVKAIVIAPADSKALIPTIEKLQKQNIVVVNIDNRLDETILKEKGMTVPFVGPNNRTGAEKVGDYVLSKLTTGSEVAIVEGVPNAFNGEQRKLGFEDAIKKSGMKLITSQTANWEMNEANNIAASMIVANPDLKCILAANDNMALGVVSAVAAAGKSGEIIVGGFDNISAAQNLIKEGKLAATADQYGDKLAAFGIDYALMLLADKNAVPADLETTVSLVSPETLK